jgi:hypothetical protein
MGRLLAWASCCASSPERRDRRATSSAPLRVAMAPTDSTSIFISHSFDHPEKYVRVQEFLTGRRISFIDRSVSARR